MNVKPYSINYDSKRLTFGFESISQKQVIQKIVLFSPLNETATVFNLALCDLDENGELHDDIISNNDDVEKIMATVIAIIGLFFETQPNKKVFFESNSPARTRLCQIAINKVFDSLSSFLIEGVTENKIEIFQKKLYCFLCIKKINAMKTISVEKSNKGDLRIFKDFSKSPVIQKKLERANEIISKLKQ